ncbi:MAG: glutamate--tRNA ligase, partial [Candidatus Levybacteria bacterium]|nr:glutamate--tRNA ligase [Candidatus Levybacteria bacterium]
EAILNFLAFLGWHPIHDREILNRDELVREFDLKRVQKAGAIFNVEKLNWLNAHYIKTAKTAELIKKLKDFVPKEWLRQKELLRKALDIEKERMEKLSDFKGLADFFFELPAYDLELLAWPRTAALNKEKILANLKLLVEEISKIFKADFNKDGLTKAIMPLTEVWGRGELLWPLRVALSGREASPGPFEIMDVIGKEESLQRINAAIEKLK